MVVEENIVVMLLLVRSLAAGGKPWQPAQDHGFMCGTSVTDPDGNAWEALWMDPGMVQH
jgi:uncharacterized protein